MVALVLASSFLHPALAVAATADAAPPRQGATAGTDASLCAGEVADRDPMTHLRRLTDHGFRGRHTGSPGYDRAAAYVREILARHCFIGPNSSLPEEPFFHRFTYLPFSRARDSAAAWGIPSHATIPAGRPGLSLAAGAEDRCGSVVVDSRDALASLDREAERRRGGAVDGYNVVGTCPGTSRPGEYIVAMAHLDTSGAILEGADDNGSGSAVLLAAVPALARLCRERRMQRSLLLAWTDAEEQGGYGAEHLAGNPLPGIPCSAVKGVVNLDMVGRWGAERLSILDMDAAGRSDRLGRMLETANSRPPRLFGSFDRDISTLGRSQDGDAFARCCRDADVPVLFLFEGRAVPFQPGGLIPEAHTNEDDIAHILRDNDGDKMRRLAALLIRFIESAANTP